MMYGARRDFPFLSKEGRVNRFSDIDSDSYIYYDGRLEKITSLQPSVREFSSIAMDGNHVHIIESCMDDYNYKTDKFNHRKISVYIPGQKNYAKVLQIAKEVMA